MYWKMGLGMILVLGILCGVHLYLARGLLFAAQTFFPKARFVFVLLFLCLLSVLMILSVARPFSGPLQQILSWLGALWMAVFVYLLLYFLASDLFFLFARLFSALPTKFPFVIRLVAVLLALLTVVLGHLHAARLQRASYSVSLTESPTEQMRVVLLSDLHLGAVASEGRLERIVSAVNEESPDVICIAGDLFDNDYSSIQNPERAVALLKSLQAKYGVYACLGNHDAGSEINKMLSFLEQAEIRLLSEEFTVINGQWILAGRPDASPIGKGVEKERQALSQLFSGADPSLPLVVMDHNPAHLSEYAGEGTLVLSGHTHKGQLFPGRLITRAMFEVDYGFGKTKSGAWAIVTSGAGTWGPPVRVGTDCEIVSIDLKY